MGHKSRGGYVVGVSFCKNCGKITYDILCSDCTKSIIVLKERITEIDKTLEQIGGSDVCEKKEERSSS